MRRGNNKNSVIERFNNPFIDHKLLDISLNSVAKFKARCLCSLLDYYNKFGKIPSVLSFAFAALINFYENFENKDYPVNDVESVLYFLKPNTMTSFLTFWQMSAFGVRI